MNNLNRKSFTVALFLVVVCFVTSAYAYGGTVDFNQPICYHTGKSRYKDYRELGRWYCKSDEIDEMWDRFDFDKHNWDDGFGYYSKCDLRRPLARTFNGLSFLKYAGGTPRCSKTNRFNMLSWAYCYAGQAIDELDGECSYVGSTEAARTQFGVFVDNYTNLYYPFFYDLDPAQRASMIVHEARHAEGWCDHKSCCKAGSDACDQSLFYGCTGYKSSFGMGAYGLQVAYLQHVALYKRPVKKWRREAAASLANYYLKNSFCEEPTYRVNPNTGYMQGRIIIAGYGDL